MITLNIPISESDFINLGLNTNAITFAEFKEKLSIDIIRQALAKCNVIAKNTGLSDMTSEEIDAEIKEVRDNAKNSH